MKIPYTYFLDPRFRLDGIDGISDTSVLFHYVDSKLMRALYFAYKACVLGSVNMQHRMQPISSCSCELGSYFTAPYVQNIYECNGNGDARIVESWDDCIEIGAKCTNPEILESGCYLQLSGETNEKGGTYRDPNRKVGSQSETVSLRLLEDGRMQVQGYQTFVVDKLGSILPLFKPEKWKILVESMSHLNRQSVQTALEFGCSSGLASMLLRDQLFPSLSILGLDHDEEYVNSARQLSMFQSEQLLNRGSSGPIFEAKFQVGVYDSHIVCENQKFDLVIALAIVHWTYAVTDTMSLGDFAEVLRVCTSHTALVEWVDPEDVAIRYFGHVGSRFRSENREDEYSERFFFRELQKRFEIVKRVGPTNPEGTRVLYRCDVRREVGPFYANEADILEKHRLKDDVQQCACPRDGRYFWSPEASPNIYRCVQTSDGSTEIGVVESWETCLHAGPLCTNPLIVNERCLRELIDAESRRGVPCVYKQFREFGDETDKWYQTDESQSNIFRNELHMSRLLSELDRFPRLLAVDEVNKSLVFDYVGESLATAHIPGNWKEQSRDIVREMQSKGVSHNDIHVNNIMVDKSGTMRLIDFTWATPSPYIDRLPGHLASRQPQACGGKFDNACFIRWTVEEELPLRERPNTRHVQDHQCRGFGYQANVMGCVATVAYSKERFERLQRDATVILANQDSGLVVVKDSQLLCKGAYSVSDSMQARELYDYAGYYCYSLDTLEMINSYEKMFEVLYEGRLSFDRKETKNCHRLRRILELEILAVRDKMFNSENTIRLCVRRAFRRIGCV